MARILVVDDHPDNRDLLVTLLGHHGHTMLEARDGAEGMLIARAQHPGLVITDLVMPVMDGYEFVQQLRADPRLAATRVIFCTASFLLDAVRPLAAALGVGHIVPTPVEPEPLLAAVDAALAAAPIPAPAPPEEFYKKHLRLVGAKLADKVRELQDAEESLRQSEARFRTLTESSPVGVFSLDLQGHITYSNPRLLEICGLSDGSAAVSSWTDLLHTEDRERVLAGWAAAAQAGARYRGRVRIVPHGGGLRWTDIQAAPVLGGSSQLTYVGTVVDVTEMLEAQEQRDELQARLLAQRAEARFLGLLEASPDAMVCLARDGQIMLVNAQTERLFGYRRKELVGQPVEILVPNATEASHPARRAGYLAHPRPRPMGAAGLDLVGRRRDGSTFPAEIAQSTIDTDEGILVMAAIRDGTERLELQAERDRLKAQAVRDRLESQMQQSQRLESLGQLAGGVAHDFNNLLAVITNYAAFVADEIDRKAPGWQVMRDDIQQISEAAERAAGLTRQLLAFARREVIEFRPLNLNDVVLGVGQLLVRTLGEQVELTTDLATDLCTVLADPGQIEQILVNLAVNARDAMPVGGKLTIQTASTEVGADQAAGHVGMSPGRYASLKVSDTGTGMPQDVIDRAFEPFFTTKARGEGTGLGLSTVYGIVTQAGGHVSIHSEPGLGTAFTILLPATSQATTEDSPPQRATPQGGHGEIVLVVEDEAALREVTRRILASNGYQVITAVNGRDAVEIAARHHGGIDVLVTDVVMPQMAGKEAAEQIRARYPAVKVLFMSGYTAGALDSDGVLEADVNLIEKPFTESSLLAKLRDVMSVPG